MLASSEFGEPNAYEPGFDLDDVAAGRYGSRLHFWNLSERRVEQTLELGETGLVPFEVRWLHDPDADEGFVGAALSSTMWHFHRDNGSYTAEQVIAVDGVEQDGWPFPVPGLITDLVVSMDDRFLYFSNWLHGDLRQYDISDPANPRLTGQLQLGGVLGRPSDAGRELDGGPQMLQLSLDGRRLYVTNSLYSTWDNQFYPGLRSWLLRVNCAPTAGWRSTPTSSSTSTTAPTARRAPTRSASRAATAPPRSSSDPRARRRLPHRGDARRDRPGTSPDARGHVRDGACPRTSHALSPTADCQEEVVMATFAVTAEHPPDLCPTSNAQTRQILRDGAGQIAQLAEQLGINIVTLRIFGPDHIILAVVEASDHRSRQELRPPESPHAMEHREDPCHVFDRGGSRAAGHGGADLLSAL